MAPLAVVWVWNLPSEPGLVMPRARKTSRFHKNCSPANPRDSAAEIQQRIGQALQLLQRQGLDTATGLALGFTLLCATNTGASRMPGSPWPPRRNSALDGLEAWLKERFLAQLSQTGEANPEPMLRRLILHAGPHKTGTSALQAVLRERQFAAFYYPSSGQWPDGAHHNLVFSLIPELRRPDAEALEPQHLLEQLQDELSAVQHDTLLISSEFLSTGCAARVVAWLVEQGIAQPDGIRALLVERELRSRAASLYNQAVKDPYVGETRSPQEWLAEEEAKLRLEPMVADQQAAGTKVEVLPYAPAESLVQRLLVAAGAKEEELPDQVSWRNMSMSGPVLMALLEVNRTVSGPEERIARRTELLQSIRPAFAPSSPMLFEGAAEVSV